MNILIVEDDPTDMKLFSAVLTSNNHCVFEKVSAEEAFDAITAITAITATAESYPDLILLDLKLPGMNGLALTRLLKQNSATCHIPIIAMTAASELFSKEQALNAGCNAFITKPLNTRTLSEHLVSTVTSIGRLDQKE